MKHEDAVASELEGSLSGDERVFLDELAEGIARRRLTAAAIFFLESVKPLGFVGSQVLYFLQPLVRVVWPEPHRYDQLARLLERRGSIELLLRRLEARA
jgi:hypothetical protein